MDDVQYSAPCMSDSYLSEQKDNEPATSTPSERLELLYHMTSPDVVPESPQPDNHKEPSYLEQARIVDHFIFNSPDPKSLEALKLLCSLEEKWPTAPPREILFGEPWGYWKKPIIRMNTRLTNNIEDALANLAKAGYSVSESEQTYLRYIITHWLGWSACDPLHMDDPCFKFIQYSYRHLGHLYPILDDIWWPEIVEKLPPGINPYFPLRMLLCNGKTFYVYLPEIDMMHKAGSTLEEVFLGLRDREDQQLPGEGSWECEDGLDLPDGHSMYFPWWKTAKNTSDVWVLGEEIEPFIPPDE